MKLTKAQREFLTLCESRPASIREARPHVINYLWMKAFIDKFGTSFHITDAGRKVLEEAE